MALPNVFSPGQVFSAANANLLRSNQYNQTVTNKTASYTPTTTTDIGTRVIMNSASATTITINTSIYAAGDTLFLSNIGVGVCTVTAGTCTITSAGPLAIPQYGGGILYFTSASAAIYYPTAVTIPAASSGLTFISKTTLTAATQHNLLNVFSTTYDHYLIKFESLATASSNVINLRYGTAGTPDTGSNYANTGLYVDSSATATSEYRYNSSSSCIIGTSGLATSMFLEVSSPFLASKTTYGSIGSGRDNSQNFLAVFSGVLNTTTSYTDLVLVSGVNISGVVSIYGYAKS